MSEERWKCLEVPFCYVGMVYVCRYSKYHHKIWTNHKKKKKKKKKATRPTLFENFMLLQYNNFFFWPKVDNCIYYVLKNCDEIMHLGLIWMHSLPFWVGGFDASKSHWVCTILLQFIHKKQICSYKLRLNKKFMSQSLWQNGRPDSKCIFRFPPPPHSTEMSIKFESVTYVQYEI